jgi:hypothetical protein
MSKYDSKEAREWLLKHKGENVDREEEKLIEAQSLVEEICQVLFVTNVGRTTKSLNDKVKVFNNLPGTLTFWGTSEGVRFKVGKEERLAPLTYNESESKFVPSLPKEEDRDATLVVISHMLCALKKA